MKYIISSIIPEIRQPQQIDETEYQEITNARKLAWDILLVKEHFSYVIRNFCQLAREIQKIETEVNKLSTEENIHLFNLLVMNLLTICRTYLELFQYKDRRDKEKEIFSENHDIRDILTKLKKEHHDTNILCFFFGN